MLTSRMTLINDTEYATTPKSNNHAKLQKTNKQNLNNNVNFTNDTD